MFLTNKPKSSYDDEFLEQKMTFKFSYKYKMSGWMTL